MLEQTWFHSKGGVPNGPVSEAEMVELLRSCDISGETLVWSQGMANWTALQDTPLRRAIVVPPPLPFQSPPPLAGNSPSTNSLGSSEHNSLPQSQLPPMSFAEAFNTCYSKYSDFSGRARRSEYWNFMLYSFLFNLVLMIFETANGENFAKIGLLLALVFLLLPSISVTVRRLHDVDFSGWYAILLVIPVIGFFGLLYFLCQRGTIGPNRFGPDPLAAP